MTGFSAPTTFSAVLRRWLLHLCSTSARQKVRPERLTRYQMLTLERMLRRRSNRCTRQRSAIRAAAARPYARPAPQLLGQVPPAPARVGREQDPFRRGPIVDARSRTRTTRWGAGRGGINVSIRPHSWSSTSCCRSLFTTTDHDQRRTPQDHLDQTPADRVTSIAALSFS
jgi:hypothetical protein